MPGAEVEAALLRIEAVEAAYQRSIVALHGVSLSVRPGEIHALLGANGAGKSTTLKAVSNLLPAERGQVTAGRIVLDGHDVGRTATADLVRLGLVQVLEGRHCFRSLTVEENLLTGALGRSARRAEAADDLARVYEIFPRLKAKRRVLAGLSSGGEQQMTAIGRALMSRPRLLVLDEPSMGLAPLVVRDIFEQLQAQPRAGPIDPGGRAELDRGVAVRRSRHRARRGGGGARRRGAGPGPASRHPVLLFRRWRGGQRRRGRGRCLRQFVSFQQRSRSSQRWQSWDKACKVIRADDHDQAPARGTLLQFPRLQPGRQQAAPDLRQQSLNS